MKDLTILFLTSNLVPEKWAEYHKEVLLKAAGDYPIITFSKKPTNIGTNILDEPHTNSFYWQMLRGAKLATTPYIAVAEDDTLYGADHFSDFRPPLDTFAYNLCRWSLYVWGAPLTYSWRDNKVGAAFIGPRELAIEALEERFAKYPEGMFFRNCGELGTGYEKILKVMPRKSTGFYSCNPIIQINHDHFSGVENIPENIARRHKKRMGPMRSYDIPIWGKAEDLIKKFQ